MILRMRDELDQSIRSIQVTPNVAATMQPGFSTLTSPIAPGPHMTANSTFTHGLNQ